LARHPDRYVTVAQLAEYWQVSRRQIYKQIDAGLLEAIRLGPRLYRIRTQAALEFEERAHIAVPHAEMPLRQSGT
jgi:excisionase family DNA binding protein